MTLGGCSGAHAARWGGWDDALRGSWGGLADGGLGWWVGLGGLHLAAAGHFCTAGGAESFLDPELPGDGGGAGGAQDEVPRNQAADGRGDGRTAGADRRPSERHQGACSP
eukprot:645759-Prorocentrum_minimum.AAC.5